MVRRSATFALLLCLAGLAGCGYTKLEPGTEVEVRGKVTLPGGISPVGLRIGFQATGGSAVSNALPLGADGSFSGKLMAGKYTYLIVPKSDEDRATVAAVNALPESYRKASLDRQISVSGGELSLSF